MIQTLTISHLFPTEKAPFQASFIKERIKAFALSEDISTSLIVPTPYAIPFTTRYNYNNSNLLTSVGHRVNYLSFPKKRFPKIITKSISKAVLPFAVKGSFDIIHVHWLYPDGLLIPELKKNGFKSVLTIHGSDWYQTRQNFKLVKILEKALQDVDYILFSGDDLQSDILQAYPDLGSKSDTIHNFVDSSVFYPSTVSKKEQKIKLGWNPDRISALTVSNIRPEKGIDLLVNSILENKDLQYIDFHIVSGIDKTSFSQKVYQLITRNPFKNIFIHPPIEHKKLQQFYSAADIYISPSRREGFGLAMIEALFCGTPFYATNVGIAPFAESLKFGRTFQTHKLTELSSNSIIDVIQNSIVDKDLLESTFGISAYLKKIKSIYTNIL